MDLKQQLPRETAYRMTRRYGFIPALEFADQYIEDAEFIFNDPSIAAYWKEVRAVILDIGPN